MFAVSMRQIRNTMRIFSLSHLKKAAAGLLIPALMLPLTSCDMIIINDMSWNNVSDPETESNISDSEPSYTPVEYTPYQQKEDYSAMSEAFLDALPQRNFDGAVFFITTPSTDYIDPDNTEDTVSRMIYDRNRMIEERYNVSIIPSLADVGTMLTEVKQAADSEMYYTDLMMIPLYMTGQFRLDNVLMNLRSLPFLDLTAPYFNSESVSMTSAGYDTYGVAGHATLSPSAFSAMFFNRDLVEAAGMDQPFSLAANRTWTWDRFFEYTAAVSDLNGGEPCYTVGAQNNASRLADLIFVSCGNSYIHAERKTTPILDFSPDSARYALTAANRILTDSGAVIDPAANAIEMFADGKMLFLTEYLNIIPQMTDSQADWGVLPLPLQEEHDLYRTLVSNNELIFTVPAHHNNGEFVSVILSALNAGSYGSLYDEYINQTLTYHLRDNDSANMLELILDSAAFDFALAFGNSYPAVAQGTYALIRESAKNNDLAERFEEAKKAAEEALTKDFNLDS